jgi:hypothetical protein
MMQNYAIHISMTFMYKKNWEAQTCISGLCCLQLRTNHPHGTSTLSQIKTSKEMSHFTQPYILFISVLLIGVDGVYLGPFAVGGRFSLWSLFPQGGVDSQR